MKIFVCEFITAGGFVNQILPEKLAKEGDMMLQSVLNDLQKIDTLHATVTRDSRLDSLSDVDELILIEDDKNPFDIWEECFHKADICLIIAPETNNILYRLHELAEKNDCEILGCDLDSIKLTSSKILCLEMLRDFELFTPRTAILEKNNSLTFPFVLKPDDGVGCENCFFIETESQLSNTLDNNFEVATWINQEYLKGINASVSILSYKGEFKILSINEQEIEINQNQFFLRSIVVNKYFYLYEKIKTEIEKILTAIPGLSGIIGIDCVFSENDIYILEINPRLTTSYCGLSKSITINPMQYLLETFESQKLEYLDIESLNSQQISI